ncbi:GL26462 [Drosophila persimilis]|uniref:GL26462 n=1 Tax=Drosophila persimilis TaxID=7234 RepID=B4GUQ9_DROPE|nr:GL26462 [Drosophila persimilis]
MELPATRIQTAWWTSSSVQAPAPRRCVSWIARPTPSTSLRDLLMLKTILLQDQQRDDLSLDGRMSSSSQQTHHSDEKLLNESVSSRSSSPGLEPDEPPATRACIVRTLSIETSGPTTAPSATTALSLMSNSLSLALAPQ